MTPRRRAIPISSPARRRLLAAGLAGTALAAMPAFAQPAQRLRIGIVGSGRIGGTLGAHWAKAGHDVMFSDIDPAQSKRAAEAAGPRARSGTSREAVQFGDVVLVSVPYGAMAAVGRELGDLLKGKVVMDTANAFPGRDGDIANRVRELGSGVVTAQLLPGARVVRAFNQIGYAQLNSEAHRSGEKLGVPMAGDDKEALATASRLVEDAGFTPVVAGPLARSKDFDVGSPLFGRSFSASEVRKLLGVNP